MRNLNRLLNECGNVPTQIEQRMHFDCGFVLAKLRPWKNRQAKIDGCRVQGVETLIHFDADGIIDIQRTGDRNQNLCEVRVDAPVAQFIGVG